MKTVFQNDHWVVVDKEAGVLTVPAREGIRDPRRVLGLELQKKLGTAILPVHRLDFEVSGLVVYALTRQAQVEASNWFEKKQVQKKYFAVTPTQSFAHWPENIACERHEISKPSEEALLWKSKIRRGKKRSFESPTGDLAETKAWLKKIDRAQNRCEWELFPLTGRSHQLRFELSRHGFPIWGDELYGSTVIGPENTIALKAVSLSFEGVKGSLLGMPANLNLSPEISFN